MNFKFLLVFFSAVMLAACGKPDTDLGDVQPAVAPKASSTAIFFPGGGGIDFGIKPEASWVGKNGNNIASSQSYRFRLKENALDIERSIRDVLAEQNYQVSINEGKSNKDTRVLNFKKNNGLVLVVTISTGFGEGFSEFSRISIWHKI